MFKDFRKGGATVADRTDEVLHEFVVKGKSVDDLADEYNEPAAAVEDLLRRLFNVMRYPDVRRACELVDAERADAK